MYHSVPFLGAPDPIGLELQVCAIRVDTVRAARDSQYAADMVDALVAKARDDTALAALLDAV